MHRRATPNLRRKPVLLIAKPRRYRSKDHLRFVACQACLICGRQPSDPHHLRYAQPRALGRKASDEFTLPLCRVHHREVHRMVTSPPNMKLDPADAGAKSPLSVLADTKKRRRKPARVKRTVPN
jgi:hypothetical protein